MATNYHWWRYVKSMVRKYPEREARLRALRAASTTANWSGGPRGKKARRTTEDAALRELGRVEMRELEAVEKALAAIRKKDSAPERERLLELVYWRKTHTIPGAALELHISRRSAERYNQEFLYLVAEAFGIWEPGEK